MRWQTNLCAYLCHGMQPDTHRQNWQPVRLFFGIKSELAGYGQPCTHRIAVHHGAWTFEHGCDCRHACRTIRLKIWEGSFGLSQTLTLYLQIHAINFANSPSIFSFATRHRKFAKFHAQLGQNFTADSKATARHKLSFLPIAP